MEIQALKTFLAVVEEGGILSAASRLNTVQSNVTTRIKRLEEEVGTQLFYRQGRKLTLSPSGKVLLGYTREILQLTSQAGMALRQVGEQVGEFRVGSMESFAALRLPPTLKGLREVHSGLRLHIETNTSTDLIKRVLEHKLDCAFVGGPVDHPDLLATHVLTEELVLVYSKDTQYQNIPLIIFRDGCSYRQRALNWRQESGHNCRGIMEFGTLDGMLGCVAMGLGCTLMPRAVVTNSRYHNDFHIETIEPHLAEIPTLLIRHKNAASLAAVDTLIKAASEPLLMH
ncbi:MAG: transcriptional regulator [Oceanospirillaceae bacterium]|nr:transcriptional regulator [Oceanospirillaceae bacterium]|tara:strand:+ start:587 stop:1441 length:855 start_codon:yes stop_codon:yes gene_type:complete